MQRQKRGAWDLSNVIGPSFVLVLRETMCTVMEKQMDASGDQTTVKQMLIARSIPPVAPNGLIIQPSPAQAHKAGRRKHVHVVSWVD